MSKTRSALFFLILLAFTMQESNSSSLETLSNAFASENGEVLISQDSNGMFVEVDLSYKPSSDLEVAKMLLGLANSNTILANNECLHFSPYNCSNYNCTEIDFNPVQVTFPYFSAWVKYATADAYLDYSSWNLNAFAFLVQSCIEKTTPSYGAQRKGVLGMGTSDNSVTNFIHSKFFSISLNKNLPGGKLLFWLDFSLVTSADPISLTSNANWQVSLIRTRLEVGAYSTTIDGTLIFDIHTDSLGFPEDIFSTVMHHLGRYLSWTCSTAQSRPSCTLNGYLSSLPNITLHISGSILSIPPEVYVLNPSDKYMSGITLNLKALGPNLYDENYVTEFFHDAIILGAPFMSYYYTVFDYTTSSPKISLYVAAEASSGSNNLLIALGIFILVCTIAGCVCYQKKKLPQAPAKDPVIVQPPLIINNVVPSQGYVQAYSSPIVNQPIHQQPGAYIQPPGYYPPQQYQQPGGVIATP